jgi:ribosome-binding factor A
MGRRTERINHLLREEISVLLARQVKDPRLSRFITVTRVSTAPDLSNAKVFISTLGDETEKQEVLNTLTSASGYLRRELRERITLRSIPELSFYRDDSIEQGARVLQLIQLSEDGDLNQGEH